MNQLIYVVGDRVRMRHPAPHSVNAIGTVTMVFSTALDYYDVKFDTAPELRVVHASGMEYSPEEVNLKAPFWTDDAGHRHHTPTMRDLPPLLRLGIKRMVAIIAGSPAAHRDGKQTIKENQEQATEAVNILLSVLLPRLSHDEIDRHPYGEKRHFVARWCGHHPIPFVVSA